VNFVGIVKGERVSKILRTSALNSLSTLHTGLRLCDRKAIITSKWKDTYDCGHKYSSEWEGLSCRKLPMDGYANCGIILPKL